MNHQIKLWQLPTLAGSYFPDLCLSDIHCRVISELQRYVTFAAGIAAGTAHQIHSWKSARRRICHYRKSEITTCSLSQKISCKRQGITIKWIAAEGSHICITEIFTVICKSWSRLSIQQSDEDAQIDLQAKHGQNGSQIWHDTKFTEWYHEDWNSSQCIVGWGHTLCWLFFLLT